MTKTVINPEIFRQINSNGNLPLFKHLLTIESTLSCMFYCIRYITL